MGLLSEKELYMFSQSEAIYRRKNKVMVTPEIDFTDNCFTCYIKVAVYITASQIPISFGFIALKKQSKVIG